ncbi:MinD/ParA family protein, partial [Nanoarchaeota archaeon]
LASEFDKHVLVVDTNLSAPNLGIHFGFIDMEHTIHDVLSNKTKTNKAIYEYDTGLHIMPGILKGKYPKQWDLNKIIDEVRKKYDIILLDTSPNLDELSSLIEVVDEFIAITTPDYPSLSTTLQLADILKKSAVIRGVIINSFKGKRFELKKQEIEETTSIPVLGVLPYDLKIQKSIAELAPLYYYRNRRKFVRRLREVARQLV